jgi:hypothetical protein
MWAVLDLQLTRYTWFGGSIANGGGQNKTTTSADWSQRGSYGQGRFGAAVAPASALAADVTGSSPAPTSTRTVSGGSGSGGSLFVGAPRAKVGDTEGAGVVHLV